MPAMHVDFDQKIYVQGLEVKKLEKCNSNELQDFLEEFNDFFILCEGIKASAKNILLACPPSKNIHKDKICLGLYKANDLIGFLDLIKNYPLDRVLVIGYLLIHPAYRKSGIGTLLVDIIVKWAEQSQFQKLRLSVQRQNFSALAFWQKNKFKIIETRQEKLGKKINTTDILERTIYAQTNRIIDPGN